MPIAGFDDTHIETVLLPHFVVVQRRRVVQIIGYDIAAFEVLLHAVEQVALGLDSTAGKGDFFRPGVDECGEEMLRFVPGRRPLRPPRFAHFVRDPVDIAVQGCGGVDTERVGRGIIKVGSGLGPRKVGADRVEVGS